MTADAPPCADSRIADAFPHLRSAGKVALQPVGSSNGATPDVAGGRALNVGVVLSGGQAPGEFAKHVPSRSTLMVLHLPASYLGRTSLRPATPSMQRPQHRISAAHGVL